MAQWYIGKERAKYLLNFAESELAKYAYRVPADDYRRVLNILRTQIPMWAEERRGPVNAQGVPLFSLKGYLNFIKWWIAKLLFPNGGKMTKTSAGWIRDVFDPARKVFGRRLGAAVDMGAPGADVLMNPEINIGPYYAKLLYLHGLEALYKYTETLKERLKGNPSAMNILNNFIKEMDDLLTNMTNKWQNELLTPTDPDHPQYHIGLEGSGAMDKLYKALDEFVYYNTRQALFNVAPDATNPDYSKYGFTDTYSPKSFQPGVMSQYAGKGYEEYMPDPFMKVGPVPGFMTFAQLIRSRGDDLDLVGQLIRKGDTYAEATHKVNQAIGSITGDYAVGPNGSLDDTNEAKYKSDLATVKMALGL